MTNGCVFLGLMSTTPHTLIVVCGPTASGKTALALRLAQHYGCSIVCADSRQIYKGMDIGTTKPTPEEQALVPHYGLDLVAPDETYNAARYAGYALPLLDKLFAQSPIQVMCGGTGLYIKAVCKGLDDIPAAKPETRSRFNDMFEREGLPGMLSMLSEVDPAAYVSIDLNNSRRVIRALEVWMDTGKPLSEWQKGQPEARPFEVRYVAIDYPRDELYRRINQRVLTLLEEGLLDEVRNLLATYGDRAPGLLAIGYTEVIQYLQGKWSYDKMKDKLQQHTRNYAKRQLTWFRGVKGVNWLDPNTALAAPCDTI